MNDLRLALIAGIDIPVPECKVIIHQPTIKEIAYMGEFEFFASVQTLTIDKKLLSQDESLLGDITNFQIFMMIMNEKETVDKKDNILSLFQLILPGWKVSITPRSIFLSSEGKGTAIIDENNFLAFTQVINEIFCLKSNLGSQSSFNPANKKANEIAEKLLRARQRVASQKGERSSSSLSQYLSTLTVGIGSMSLDDCLNLTLYQLYDLIERYSLYTNWDIDIRSRLAGAKIEKQPDNWMKNIH